MSEQERQAVLEAALQKWGEAAQTDMCIEEMSELTKALLKVRHLHVSMIGSEEHRRMIDTVDALVKSTLAALCPNVARLLYRGKAGTFFTYQLVSSEDRDAAEDEMQGTEYTYRVDLYSKRDYIALLRRTKRALKAAGFYGIVIDPEAYETDTGFYHVPIECRYYEKTEV